MEDVVWKLASVAMLIFANGFFVAAEFALVTVRKTKIDELLADGHVTAKYVKKALGDLDRYIAGTQVGITIASLALGWIGEPALVKFIHPIVDVFAGPVSQSTLESVALGTAFTIITFLHVILGELVPKSLALQKPEATSLAVARPMGWVIIVLRPLIWSLNGLGGILIRMIGLENRSDHGSVHSTGELESLIRQSAQAGHLDEVEQKMLQKTFRFSETTAGEIMMPRSEIQALNVSMPFEEILKFAQDANYSRLPIFENSIDNILGLVYIHDLFRLSRQQSTPRTNVRSIIRKALFVPESAHLDSLLKRLRKERTQMAVVVDEHGGTAGLLTFDDVVETIFGDFQDHNEDSHSDFVVAQDGTMIIRGDTRLDDLNEAMEWNLVDDQSDTIAGFLMTALGSIGYVGAEVNTEHGLIRIVAMERLKITQVKITLHDYIAPNTKLPPR